jgi:hypothetical protein
MEADDGTSRTFPGSESDQRIIRTVKDDLGAWNLHRLVWVADAGFASAANRAYLTRGGGHYLHAEKLRHTNAESAAALARPGRYHDVADNLQVKEVRVAPGGGKQRGGSLKHKPGLRRLVRRTKTGLLRTSDPTLTAQDLAAAHKRLIAVERGWRALLLIRVAQRSALTGDQKTILAALDLPEPPKYLNFTPFAAHPAG